MKPVLIFGAGQVAQTFAEYLTVPSLFLIDSGFRGPWAALTVDEMQDFHKEDGTEPKDYAFLVGMSFRGLNKPRAEKFAWMRSLGYETMTWRATDVWLPNSAKIGAGSFIMDRNTIQTGVEIGENVIAWSGSHFGHHCKIGNHVFIASHAVISGACEIGDYSFVGVNATIIDGVKIGKRCIIGAGATITSDCEDDGVYPGPAAVRSKVPSNKLKGIWAQ